ncbi:MAG: UDP-N-acetyl glucosamine 2-epimerase, partial [Candidatus Kapabacteria bacterium]|nr:UDP-N-acetyl glucosamine 2-epimerase [Candidatus Kapabacteria bacterium]
ITLHRPSNVDDREQLQMLMRLLGDVATQLDIVFPVHPRTRKNLDAWGMLAGLPQGVHLIEPVGYVDFLALMRQSRFVLTDSGGIQEETTALRVPCITARTTTERPVTVELGTNVLVPPMADGIRAAVDNVLNGDVRQGTVPPLWDGRAAERIAAIITSQCL